MRRSIPLGLLAATALAFGVTAGPGASAAGEEPGRLPGAWREALAWVQPEDMTPKALEGRVVVVEFWTFGCVNCRRTVPAMRSLDARFGNDVVIVGIHTPEFAHERSSEAVRQAIARERIRFPVAQDNAYRAWRAFDNRYWPALYVLDRAGRIRYVHVGELHEGTARWSQLVRTIEALRAEPAPRG
jgi:thiol-disulfide isomerase/thioredoxin